jgi:hypothetical protein
MNSKALRISLVLGLTLIAGIAGAQTPLQIYGAWHCGNDYCTWGTVRDLVEFDQQNHWLIDRGDGVPSVNLVVLAFVNPWKLLNQTTDDQTLNGIQRGMNQDLVNYFKSNGIRVSLSMGGITYIDYWNDALATDPVQLAVNAAAVAQDLGVGFEIDYEENQNPNLPALQTFIDTYRAILPYDATGTNHAARLTIDLAAGDRWLIALTEKATKDWLTTSNPVLDYANAMVTARPYRKATDATDNWQEHVDGKPQYDPPIPPLAPAKFTGSLWLTSRKPLNNCIDFYYSMQFETGDFVQNLLPNGAGVTPGMLGYMFWAAECQGTRALCTTPYDNNTCEGGMGVASSFYSIPVPMPPLRQE